MTRLIEWEIARNVFRDARLVCGIRFTEPPTHIPVRSGPEPGSAVLAHVPVEDHPRYLALPVPEPAGILSARSEGEPTRLGVFFRELDDDTARKARREQRGFPQTFFSHFQPMIFWRFLAKVAIGTGVWHFGVDGLDYRPIRNVLFSGEGWDSLIGGTTPEMLHEWPPPGSSQMAHRAIMWMPDVGGWRWAAIQLQLFAVLGAPTYTILLGPLYQPGLDRAEKRHHFISG